MGRDGSAGERADGEPAPAAVPEPSSRFPGEPGGLERLYVPHRMAYLDEGPTREERGCPFCEGPRTSNEEALIVARGETCFVVLNLFPYNAGHLLVCPYRHIGLYDEASDAEMLEMGRLTQTAMRVHREVSRCDGFNIGMNQGAVAGAGIAGHLHQHLVPRWAQDANFFPIIAETKAIPRLLGELRATLAAAWPAADA